jgi:hypothetical protein
MISRAFVAFTKELRQTTPEELQQRGKELRAALDKAYDQTRAVRAHEIDITETVLPYIPVGISFVDAEGIVRNAGFSVERPDLEKSRARGGDWYAVTAIIPFFRQPLLGKVSIYLYLIPKSPGDYTTVAKIKAAMLSTVL